MKSKMTSAARVVLVAGGTGGLGRAVSLAFLEAGAWLVVTYRKREELDSLRNLAAGNGSQLEGYDVDVTNEAAVSQLVEGIAARRGRLDAMVNTVGGYAGA
jgi:NAD(P)-dependent dehydrogenase (short-subunit alcohol dehydrogenase family)